MQIRHSIEGEDIHCTCTFSEGLKLTQMHYVTVIPKGNVVSGQTSEVEDTKKKPHQPSIQSPLPQIIQSAVPLVSSVT